MSCMNSLALSDETFLLACGHEDGRVQIWQLVRSGPSWETTELLSRIVHQGYVSSIAFLSEERIVTGGQDRRIVICRIERGIVENDSHFDRVLHLTLRCEGLQIEGVKGEKEFERLKSQIALSDA